VEDGVEIPNTIFTFTLFSNTKIIISETARRFSGVNSTTIDDKQDMRITYVNFVVMVDCKASPQNLLLATTMVWAAHRGNTPKALHSFIIIKLERCNMRTFSSTLSHWKNYYQILHVPRDATRAEIKVCGAAVDK
jgi:hypothetical protein